MKSILPKIVLGTCLVVGALALAFAIGAADEAAKVSSTPASPSTSKPEPKKDLRPMKLGAFSVSLAVKDLGASRAFYEKLDFQQVMGDAKQNWLILRSGETTIGIFQGVFERNTMTFNPGWNSQAQPLKEFEDVRKIQHQLQANGLTLTLEADEKATGPGSVMLVDPDGNPILIDQHVP
jgi:catechol 2,3-dioxygenase-like lactoylglutathione lyase family enzyme